MSQLLAIIGYPIFHSLSPVMYDAAFQAMGLDARFEAWSTPPAEVPAALQRLRSPEMLGMSVTIPHKEAVIPLLDDLEPTARAIGAVNCIAKADGRLIGHNTDRYGYRQALRDAGCDPAGMRVLVLGAGGAAHAVAYALMEAGAARLTIAGRTPARVEATVRHLRAVAPGPTAIEGVGWWDEGFARACAEAQLIVNCTPIGMAHTATEGESPLGREQVRSGVWVSDIVYTPQETALLRLARAAGARTIGGLGMLVHQGVECVRLWTGRAAPFDIMMEAAAAALAVRSLQ